MKKTAGCSEKSSKIRAVGANYSLPCENDPKELFRELKKGIDNPIT